MIKVEIKYPERLLALADHIETLPQKVFDMDRFRNNNKYNFAGCGTVGCALGHGPGLLVTQFGVKKRELLALKSHQGHYGTETPIDFDKVAQQFGVPQHSDLWDYLFSSDWSTVDNTPQGTAKRIRWVVKHEAIPDNHFSELNNCVYLEDLSYMQEDASCENQTMT